MNNKTNCATIKEACNPSNYALKTISNKLPTGKDTTLQMIQVWYEDIHDERMTYKTFKRFEAMDAFQLFEVYKLLKYSEIQQNKKVIDTLKKVSQKLNNSGGA